MSLDPSFLDQFSVINDLEIAPDGRNIAYVQSVLDREQDQEFTTIWLVDAATGKQEQLTKGPRHDSMPRWAPDRRLLAFLAADGSSANPDARNLFLLTIGSNTRARRLTRLPESVEDYVWSPSGDRICFVGMPPVERGGSSANVRSYQLLRYKSHLQGWFDGRYRHLWLVHLSDGRVTQLTGADAHDGDPAFSPRGDQIAFVSNRTAGRDHNSISDIWILDLNEARSPRPLTDSDGSYSRPSFSPDGHLVAYLGYRNADRFGQNIHVWRRPVVGSGPPKDVLEAWDRPARNVLLTETRAHAPLQACQWSASGQRLYFVGSDRGASNVYALDVENTTPRAVTRGRHEVWKATFDSSRRRFAALITSSAEPGDIFVGEDGGEIRRITNVNASAVLRFFLAPAEEVTLRGADTCAVSALVLKPERFDPMRKYPLIIRIPGGPHLVYGHSFSDEAQILANNGFVVVSINPRGTQSFGEAFSEAIATDWCGKDAADILAGASELARLPYIDSERVGLTGASYGGLMVNWLIAHSDQFAAAVSQRSISNLISLFGTADFENGASLQFTFGGVLPYDDPDRYLRRSPISQARNMRTPLLLIQAGLDYNTPLQQAEELYVALKLLNRVVELVVYPNEGHYLRRYGPPSVRLDYMRRHIDWFKRYLVP